jgi:hypothetical protein
MHKLNSYLLSAAILEDWSSPRHFDYVGNVLEKKRQKIINYKQIMVEVPVQNQKSFYRYFVFSGHIS